MKVALSTRRFFLPVLVSLFVFQSTAAAHPQNQNVPSLEQLVNSADDAAKEYIDKVPFGSEWEITLIGDAHSWLHHKDSSAEVDGDVWVALNAKGVLRIPPARPEYCEFIDEIETIWLPVFGSPEMTDSSLTPEQLIRDQARMTIGGYQGPIKLPGTVKFEASNYSTIYRESNGEVSLETTCPSCPRTQYPMALPISVSFERASENKGWELGFYVSILQDLDLKLTDHSLKEPVHFRADKSPRMCVLTYPRLQSIGFKTYCPVTFIGWTDWPDPETTLEMLNHVSYAEIAFRDGTYRLWSSDAHNTDGHLDLTLRQLRPRDPVQQVSSSACHNCDDGNLCTRDYYIPGKGCVHEKLNEVFDFDPHDCYKNECQNGYRIDRVDDSEIPLQTLPHVPCEKQACVAGGVQTVPDTTDIPPQGRGNCRKETCDQYGVWSGVIDDSDTPINDPHDCLRQECRNGILGLPIPDDTETPLPGPDGRPGVCRGGTAVPQDGVTNGTPH